MIEEKLCTLIMTVASPAQADAIVLNELELTMYPVETFVAHDTDEPELDDLMVLPAPPPPPDVPNPFSSSAPMRDGFGARMPPVSPIRNSWGGGSYVSLCLVKIDHDSITMSLGQLRPGKTASSDPIHLLLSPYRPEGPLTIRWTLTSTSRGGIQEGTCDVPVRLVPRLLVEANAGVPDPLTRRADE